MKVRWWWWILLILQLAKAEDMQRKEEYTKTSQQYDVAEVDNSPYTLYTEKRNPFLSTWGGQRLSDLLHFKRRPAFSSWGGKKRGPAFSSWGGKRSVNSVGRIPEQDVSETATNFNENISKLLENELDLDKNYYRNLLLEKEVPTNSSDNTSENINSSPKGSDINNNVPNYDSSPFDLLNDIINSYNFQNNNQLMSNFIENYQHSKNNDTENDLNEFFMKGGQEKMLSDTEDKRAAPAFNSWGGKRAPAFNSWGGKRAPAFNSWGGKRAPAFNSWGGKRASVWDSKSSPAFYSWGGKRSPAFNSWGGKRAPAFNSWGGKREAIINRKKAPAFYSWGGKRSPAFNSWGGKRAPAFNSWGGKRSPAFNSWGGKRAPAFNSWGGKRAPAFNSWGGKRAPAFNSWGGKRAPAFNSWGGKRSPAFNSWGGKRSPAFNSWGGKRTPAFNSWGGKRSPAFNSWGGKRDRASGKKNLAFHSWGGKRSDEESFDVLDEEKRAPSFHSWGGKRSDFKILRQLLRSGKRIPAFYSWGGKRSLSDDQIKDTDLLNFTDNNSLDPISGLNDEELRLLEDNYFGNSDTEDLDELLNDDKQYLDNDGNIEKRYPGSVIGGKRKPAFSSWGGKRSEQIEMFDPKRDPENVPWGEIGKANDGNENYLTEDQYGSYESKQEPWNEVSYKNYLDVHHQSKQNSELNQVKESFPEMEEESDESADGSKVRKRRSVVVPFDNDINSVDSFIDLEPTVMCCFKRVQYGDKKLFMQMLLRTKGYRELSWPTIRPMRRGADFYPWGGKRSL